MILGTARGSANIPKEGIKLTKEEALNHQKNLVENWPSVTEVFFLRFGRYITTAATFICSAACINAFHPILKFGRGTITAVIPAISLSTALVYYKTDNMYGSLAFPGILGLLSTSSGHGIPYTKTDTREYWKKTFEIVQTRTLTFQRIIFIQVMLAFVIPYIQNSEITKIMKQVVEDPAKAS